MRFSRLLSISLIACAAACPTQAPNTLQKKRTIADDNTVICNDELCEFTIKDSNLGSEVRVEVQAMDMTTPNLISIKTKGGIAVFYKFCRDEFSLSYAHILECKVLYSCSDGLPHYSLSHGSVHHLNHDGPEELKHLCKILPATGEFTVVP